MLQPIDVVTRAARQGLVVSLALATEALGSVDRDAHVKAQRDRFEVVMWDGKTDPPIGDRDRWLHGQDGVSRFAADTFGRGGVAYFLLCDGALMYWQPWPFESSPQMGRHMVDDESHPDHWRVHADTHVNALVDAECDQAHFRTVMEETLRLHEERQVPVHAVAVR